MPDISMCSGVNCPLKKYCYRYRAVPTELRQSYYTIPPFKDGNCDKFWDITDKPEGYYRLSQMES
jgi:hypothetical protein